MSDLYYPGGPTPYSSKPTKVVLDSIFSTFKYFYRVRDSRSNIWGPEIPYAQGTHLTYANNTGQTLTFFIEFITRQYRTLDGIEVLPESRRTETFQILSSTHISIPLIAAAPTGPITDGTVTITATINFDYGPIVPYAVTGTFELLDGVTVVYSGTLTFTNTAPNVWEATDILLYTYLTVSPESRDLHVTVTATPTGYANTADGEETFPGYWISTIVAPETGEIFREIMTNFQSYWMNMDRLPGVRHSIKPLGGDVSADDLYLFTFEPESDTQAYIQVATQVLGDSPTTGWSYSTSEVSWITDTRAETDPIFGVRVEFKYTAQNGSLTAQYINVTHVNTGLSFNISLDALIIGNNYSMNVAFPLTDMSGDWIYAVMDGDGSGMTAIEDLTITFKKG